MHASDAARRLGRLGKFARADGIGVLVLAGLALAGSVAAGRWIEAGFCLLAMVTGGVELAHARTLLSTGRPARVHFLRLALCQVALAVLVIAYACQRLATLDAAAVMRVIEASPLASGLLAALPDPEVIEPALALSLRLTYSLLIPLTLVFQGGIAFWYLRVGRRVLAALEPPPLPPATS